MSSALIWIISVPVQRLLGPHVQAAIADGDTVNETPRGIPAGATIVPVMLMLDGREIRQGDLRTKLDADSAGEIRRRSRRNEPRRNSASATRAATSSTASRFYVVCERIEPNGQMKVSGIYLP